MSFRRQEAEAHAEAGQDEGEFPDLRQGGGDGQGRAQRVLQGEHDAERGQRLAHDDDREHREQLERLFDQDLRVEEHPDGHEEEPRERVLQRLGIRRRTMAQVRLVDHHAREERPERERHAEELAEPNATPRASATTARVNSSREPVSSTRLRSHGKTRTPTTSISTANSAILPSVRPSGDPEVARRRAAVERPSTQGLGEGGEEHEREDDHEVLHDQPADRDAPVTRLQQAPRLQRAQQHDGARHRQRQSEHQSRAERPAPRHRDADAERRGEDDLREGAGQRDGAHREEVAQREVHPDAEHRAA